MEKKSEEAKLQMEAILSMTQLGQKGSSENLSSIKESMLSLDILYTSIPFDIDKINEAFRSIHTLKGHCATIGLKGFASLIHTEEDFWMEYRNRGSISQSEISERKNALNQLIQLIISYNSLEQQLFSSKNADSIQIPSTEFNHLLDNFKQVSKSDIKKYLLQYKDYSIIQISKSLEAIASDVADETSKKIQWVFKESEDLVPEEVWKPLSSIFGHLIRNSVDHGIELPQVRVDQNKPEHGSISFSYKASKKSHKFYLSDDGKGIDLIKVRQKALEKLLISEEEDLSEKETIELIFHPGFTTTNTVSNISGRGVGMDAVRKVIESLNGTINIGQKTGIGLEITIEIPVS